MEIPVEAERAAAIVQRCFGNSILAVYLHGSAVSGGLRPYSDVDLLVVIDRPTTPAERERLMAELMGISGRPGDDGLRPVEMIVFQRADLSASVYPAHSEFVYGEWLRDAFEAGEVPEPVFDPEFTLLLAQARQEARPLFGPGPAELLPAIPHADIRRAIKDLLPALLNTLEGDERNVLLTLARMWRTARTGDFVSKHAAAEWAIARLPAEPAAVVDCARRAYLGAAENGWQTRRDQVRRAAACLRAEVEASLQL